MSYPKINDRDFYKKINKKYKKYKVPKKRRSFEEICYPKQYKLQIPQEFLAQYINPKTHYTGILIFHRIGAGKTCTAINIGEKWKKYRKIIVLTPASLKGNFRDELRSPCAKNAYLTDTQRNILKKYHPSNSKYKEIIKKSDNKINKYYEIYSYNKFVNLYKNNEISLRNKLLIVDEVQNMVSQGGKFYKILYKAIHEAPKSLRVVLLSATPMFDKPIEIALTMNLLRLPFEIPTGKEFEKIFIKCHKNNKQELICKAQNLDTFKEMIKGYVSYFRGAPPYAFPESIIRYVKCEMSSFQYRSYITVLQKEEKKSGVSIKRRHKVFKYGQIKKLPNNFFIGTRIISNIAFPNRGIGEKGYKSFKGIHLRLQNLKKYSIKFYKIIKRINRCSGTVFCYSTFKKYGGIMSFVRVLESQNYKNYADHGEGRKRFAIYSGNEKIDYKDEIKAVFNQPDNYNGSKLKIMLITKSGAEGLSLKRVQQAHLLEPYWNWSRMAQIIGRGVRYCSHKDMEENKRIVRVYIYIATHKNEEKTIDEYIKNMALDKHKLIEEFSLAIKEAAIDCDLLKNANVYKDLGEQDIECEK